MKPGIGAAKSLHRGAEEVFVEIAAFSDNKGPKLLVMLMHASGPLEEKVAIFSLRVKQNRRQSIVTVRAPTNPTQPNMKIILVLG
jgi:hypothetical protein